MRLLTLLSPALLAACAFAEDSTPDSSDPAASPEASPKEPDPTPVGEIWAPKWTSTASALDPYKTSCHSTTTLSATIYKLGELYPTLKQWAPELKIFYNRQHYPGSWNGEDKHGTERELLKMDYEALPYGVREWLSKNTKQRHFSVQEEVVFFAPGAIYPILPLFVEDVDAKGCDGVFENLDDYSAELEDGKVSGKVDYKKSGKNDVEITIEAFKVKAKEQARDEL